MKATRGSRIVRSLWAACLLIGGLNHARILLPHGLARPLHGIVAQVEHVEVAAFDPLPRRVATLDGYDPGLAEIVAFLR